MTIQSAKYANAEQTAAVKITSDAGAVLVSQADTPAAWVELLAWGTPAAYVAPPAPVPAVISRRQFYQQLANEGTITQAEALAALGGAIPDVLLGLISQLPTESQFPAQMHLAGSNTFERAHPLSLAIGAAQGKTSAQVDAFFQAAGAL